MITEIKTLQDVVEFAKYLVEVESLNFHPDDDFKDYVKIETSTPTYTAEEAEIRNNLMNQAFDVCNKAGVEIYEIMFV
jgi:hypothetical protein